MSFAFFRKNQKLLLYSAAAFTVAVFVFFPSMGDMDQVLRGDAPGAPSEMLGTFTVATTGEAHEVTYGEFQLARQHIGRLAGGAEEDAVWRHLMLLEDARGAGLKVSDGELFAMVKAQVFGGQPMTSANYRAIWHDVLQFDSARTFEAFFRELILVQRWSEALQSQARIVDADDVFQRWKVDNELFDLDVAVFADVDAETIADPGEEVLRAYFDDMPEFLRNRRFVDPATYDLAYAWLPLDADVASLPAERLAEIEDAVTDGAVTLRFDQQKAERFPDLEEADDAATEVMRNEVTIIELVAVAHRTWVASVDAADPVEGPQPEDGGPGSRAAFIEHMTGYGLRIEDPEGALDPDGLEALPHIGSANLAAQLFSVEAGDSRFYRPFGDTAEAHVLYVQAVTAERPLTFDEDPDLVLEEWRAEPAQTAAAANEFHEELKARARTVEEAAAIIEPLEQGAADAAELAIAEAIEAGEELDDEAKQAIRDEQLEGVQFDIDARVAGFEHRAWDELLEAALASGEATERLSFEAVPRSYRANLDEDVDRTTLEYFAKSNGSVFQLAVDGITRVLRYAAGNQSIVIRVSAREFPEKAAMFADADGMKTARDRLGMVRVSELTAGFSTDLLMAPKGPGNPHGHDLRIVVRKDPAAEVAEGEAPPASAADGAGGATDG